MTATSDLAMIAMIATSDLARIAMVATSDLGRCAMVTTSDRARRSMIATSDSASIVLTPTSTPTRIVLISPPVPPTVSLFAYVADGRNGLKVLQLTSPDSQRNFYGFSPPPRPELIAFAKTPTPAVALSKGLDRDRAVDETGGQMAIFGRLSSRPFTRSEMEKLFLTRSGAPWKVSDEVDMNRWVGRRPTGPVNARRREDEPKPAVSAQ